MAYKVYISPEDRSSNTYHSSVLYNGHQTNEHEQMCRLADLLEAALKRCGIEVKNDQETGSGAVYRRIERSNAWPADLHIALHTNGFDGTVQGTRVHCYPSAKSRKIGKLIQDRIAPLSPGTAGERVVESATLIELKNTHAPAVLPEYEFHDNAESARWLVENMPLIAEETCHAICDYFGVAYTEPEKKEESPLPQVDSVRLCPVNLPRLSKGSKGATVKALQILLNGYGANCGTADGDFGKNTKAAVVKYQKDKGLSAGGVVGKDTWTKLLT